MFLLVSLPWYVLVQRETGGEFLREFIIHQNLQRALGEDFQHNMPFYFYVPTYLIGFFPWSVFVPLAWVRYVKRRPQDAAGEASLFAAIWIAAMVVIFSISRSKLPAYIYPVYPASALLVGRLWSEAIESGAVDSLRRYAVAAVALAALVGTALLIGPRFLPEPVPGVGTALGAMALSIIVGTVLCLILLVRRRVSPAFAALCGGASAFALAAMALGLPIASRTVAEPAVAVAAEVRRLAPPGLPVLAYRLAPPQATLPFYARRAVLPEKTQGDMEKAVRGLRSFVVIGQQDRLDGLPAGGKLISRQGRFLIYRFDYPDRIRPVGR
jgi:4-amino-4-deoxy-L-arabinose transferase-like glycosyltransferase